MAEFRCPKHDRIFEAYTDQRKPGALANDKFPAMPFNGHPDCPKCAEEKQAPKAVKTAQTASRKIG